MSDLFEQLTRLILQDNAIFFVGNQFTAVSGQHSYLYQIADYLAAHLPNADPDRNLPLIAQQYEGSAGRTALIQALKDALAELPDQSTPIYQLLADSIAPHTKIITTRFDQALETVLNQAGKSYVSIISDDEVSFLDESRVTLIKIRGDITRADSLIITESDIDAFFERLPAINDVVRALFATKTLIFLGYDLDNTTFKQLFRQVTRKLTVFRRPAYAIVPAPLPPHLADYWKQQSVEVHVEPIATFLQTLAGFVHETGAQPAPASTNPLAAFAQPPRPTQPYKNLDSFSRADSAIFAGRRGEIARLVNRILAHPITVLYGESGNGKTSLLQAGIVPQLAQKQSLLLLTTPISEQPLSTGWLDNLLQLVKEADLPDRLTAEKELPDALQTCQTLLNGPMVLALDQFEQFFVAYSENERETAVSEMRRFLDDEQLDVRLVLVIREDFLGRIQTLEPALPGLLGIRFRLGRLDEEAARNAIEQPALPFDINWEQALVERLLYDLQVEHQVAPPQLQIVCHHLYQDALAQNTNRITLARYEILGSMGKILGDYVEEVVKAMEPEVQPVARLLLGAMVSSSRVKLRLRINDLARAAETDQETAVSILDELTQYRLVRRYETPNNLEYELAHDYLVRQIADWLGNEFWDAQRVRELLRQAVLEWENRHRLLSPSDLRMVNTQRGRVHFSDKETIVIYASSVSYDEDKEYWRSILPAKVIQSVLTALVDAPQPFVRARAVGPLAEFVDEATAHKLADLAAQDEAASVREAAAQAIRPANHQPAIDRLIAAAAKPETAVTAEAALVIIRDRETAVADRLPPSLRQKVQRQVWQRRWQRHKQTCYAAAWRGSAGGFLGFGIGMGLIFADAGRLDLKTLYEFAPGVLPSVLLGSIILAGTFSRLATAGGGFMQACLRYLFDGWVKSWSWLISSATTGIILGPMFMIVVWYSATEDARHYVFGWLAGFIIGTVITVAATAPLPGKRPFRAVLTIAIGILAFLVVNLSGLSLHNTEITLLIIAGFTTGIGFFWTFNHSSGRFHT
ncbi:MAG: SIR2 family protein [Anaerolineales bacterium]|nr:SIR2 family protein [Anaerolineales bacterium]